MPPMKAWKKRRILNLRGGRRPNGDGAGAPPRRKQRTNEESKENDNTFVGGSKPARSQEPEPPAKPPKDPSPAPFKFFHKFQCVGERDAFKSIGGNPEVESYVGQWDMNVEGHGISRRIL